MLMCRYSHVVVFWLYLRCIWDVRQCNTMMCRCSHVDRGRGGSLPMAGAGPLSDISFKVLTIIIINIVNIITKIQTNKQTKHGWTTIRHQIQAETIIIWTRVDRAQSMESNLSDMQRGPRFLVEYKYVMSPGVTYFGGYTTFSYHFQNQDPFQRMDQRLFFSESFFCSR